MNKDQLLSKLSQTDVSEIRCYDTIGSTNDDAMDWLDQGAQDFSLVISDEQTKGRGRFDRRWVTNPGSSLAFSVIMKPEQNKTVNQSLYAPLCGLAVREALSTHLNLDSEIKWPNDVLIARKKCCGILVESVWTGSSLQGIVAGIGINIAHDSLPPSDLQLFSATCLEDELGHSVDRFDLLAKILQSLSIWRERIASDDFFKEWQDHLAFKGEMVRIVQSEKQSIIGIEKGIDHEGRLVLMLDSNQEIAFEVGDVHLRPTQS